MGEHIPREATHITVAGDVTFVREEAFRGHPNIVVIICHDRVEKIGDRAFSFCPRLRIIIMPGVKEVERAAFEDCYELEHVECGKLEIIREVAFGGTSLGSIDLPSARI